MRSADLLADGLSRVREVVHAVTSDLTPEQLAFRPAPAANSICWLIWHLTRVQDDHVSEVAGTEQVWTADGWAKRFGLPLEDAETGYGHSADEVGLVRVASAELLTGYHDAVYEASLRFVRTVADADLDRIVDERWDPPVSLGVRLVSVVDDDAQHAGQAAYVRGVLTGD
ncbi:MAG: mycothiol transferase [Streptosporangiaceae bacterium]